VWLGIDPAVRRRHASFADSVRAVARSRRAMLGLAAIALGHTVMVSVMVMTPVHMRHEGAELRVVGFVISVHVAGMYALSPLVGWLADRLGRVAVILLGQAVLLLAVAVAGTAAGHDHAALGVGLFLLGLGWSCALVAGSTLLSESVAEEARPGVQGTSDFVMGLCGAAGGALAGVVVGGPGYGVLNALAGLLVVPVLFAALLARRPVPQPV
jgi:MFS family permease